jgi:nucleoid-associated protein YgaU
MNRDAKIGIVVILIIVGFLVIIWGRGEPTDAVLTPGLPTNALDSKPNVRAGTGLDAVSPEGLRVVDRSSVLPELPDLSTTRTTPDTTPDSVVGVKPEPEPVAASWTYTVKAGDAGELIAREQLGDGRRWTEVAALNNIDRNALLRIGQTLKMPPKVAVTPTDNGHTESVRPAAPANTVVYTVTKFDIGLIQIAEEQLGDKARWKEVADLNHLVKPYKILVGQKIFLPRQ